MDENEKKKTFITFTFLLRLSIDIVVIVMFGRQIIIIIFMLNVKYFTWCLVCTVSIIIINTSYQAMCVVMMFMYGCMFSHALMDCKRTSNSTHN